MKSYLTLAWKELKAQKITAVLILAAVIMSTIMTTAAGQSIGILQSMRIDQAAGDMIFVGSTPLGRSSLSLYLREYHDNALSMYPATGNVKEGRLPEKANEIALSEPKVLYFSIKNTNLLLLHTLSVKCISTF